MKSYLDKLYYWFLVGPIITLVWLRRTKKFCWMSGARQLGEGRAVGNGTFLNSVTEDAVENHHGTDDSEGEPLLIAVNNAEYTKQPQGTVRYVNIMKRISGKIAVGFLCTVCNGLFIIIFNKHKFVTRYVFYISVCMIFAYIESNVVAVFYFALNSQGFLNDLKLTALRTLAIGLTLTTSFSSSMHIIRKLLKPEESLFKSLSEN
ncbi:uncharacterized protein [Montipora foliosa]|uniref:uncharacterized protein n=1 Tax=Montipora foliosa TaxID=591990 RepID=UPI0035F16EA2